jgi:hypothetical protein
MSQAYSQGRGFRRDSQGDCSFVSSQRVAGRVGIGAPYLSDITRGNRQVSDAVAALFGFDREVVTTVTFRRKR